MATTNIESSRWSVKMVESVMRFYPRLSGKWAYDDGVVLKGIEQVRRLTEEQKYFDFIKSIIDALVGEGGRIIGYSPEEYNIDNINCGKLLFPLYKETGDKKYKEAAFLLREQLKTHPRTSEGGFWHKKIYPHQMWLDGLYMEAPFYAEFAGTFGRPEDFDDVTNQILLIEKHAKDNQTGLYFHGWDESREQKWSNPETGCSASFWGRAVGWFAMAIVDVLDYLPENHSQRKKIIEIFDSLASSLIKVQDPSTGLWYQVLDQKNRKGNYLEASASCMFVYSIAKAVRKGYIASSFINAARKGFQGVVEHLIETDEKGLVKLKNNCLVAGLGKPPYNGAVFSYRDGSFDYYVGEPVVTNDFKGIGAFILASTEIEMADNQ